MLKNELIERVAIVSGKSTKDVRLVFASTMAVVRHAVKRGQPVRLFGVGKLKVIDRADRTARNLQTGESVIVPAHKVVVLQTNEALNRLANGGE